MKISRQIATALMTRAQQQANQSLLAVMDQQEKLHFAITSDDLTTLLEQFKPGVLIYNQHPQAQQQIDQLILSDQQCCIEIFQDTDGVFGLRAYQLEGKMQTPVTLEFQT